MRTGGSRKGKRLSGEDMALWEDVTRSVKPIRKRAAKSQPAKSRAAIESGEMPVVARPARKLAAPQAPPVKTPQSKSPPAAAPLEKRLKQKIARGSQPIDARLDLHGHTQAEAHDALLRFLRRTQSRGGRLVLVITGKGGSGAGARGEGGVLKRAVPMWLALPEFRGMVIDFDNAAISHGGEGALYVRVRKVRDLP
jgi:DNA-nicking Smr family endonuclease